MGVRKAAVQEARPSKADAGTNQVAGKPNDVPDGVVSGTAKESVEEPAAAEAVVPQLRAHGERVNYLKITFHRDVMIYVPGSAMTCGRVELYTEQKQGQWIQPPLLASAKLVSLENDNTLRIVWKSGLKSFVAPLCVAAYGYE